MRAAKEKAKRDKWRSEKYDIGSQRAADVKMILLVVVMMMVMPSPRAMMVVMMLSDPGFAPRLHPSALRFFGVQ
jgi:hypothetical protein